MTPVPSLPHLDLVVEYLSIRPHALTVYLSNRPQVSVYQFIGS